MSRTKITRTIIIAVSDINDDNNRDEFRNYMLEELFSTNRTESVYEFDFNKCKHKWDEIISKIKKIIDNRTDTIYLWDVDKPKDSSNYELYRTKVGK